MTIPVTLTVGLGTSVPSPVSASPGGGSGASQTFTFTYSDTSGYQSLQVMNVMIQGNFLDGRQACYLALLPSANAVLLVDDAGDGGSQFGVLVLPTLGSVNNNQCTINGTGSSMVGSGNNITVTLSITFSGTFTGNKVLYVM